MSRLNKIVSGGQTGADRAGLDAALGARFPCGGWCPKGRKAEDGRIPEKYPLKETESADYIKRTEKNVVDSDGTIVFTSGNPTGGSKITIKYAEKHKRPWFHMDIDTATAEQAAEKILVWIEKEHIKNLNIAGSRGSKNPVIYKRVYEIIKKMLIGKITKRPQGVIIGTVILVMLGVFR